MEDVPKEGLYKDHLCKDLIINSTSEENTSLSPKRQIWVLREFCPLSIQIWPCSNKQSGIRAKNQWRVPGRCHWVVYRCHVWWSRTTTIGWSMKMQALLGAQDVWDVVLEGYTEPEQIEDMRVNDIRTQKEARMKDKTALYLLIIPSGWFWWVKFVEDSQQNIIWESRSSRSIPIRRNRKRKNLFSFHSVKQLSRNWLNLLLEKK